MYLRNGKTHPDPKLYKIQISFKHGSIRRQCHFCYLPNRLKQQFDKYCNIHLLAPHYFIRMWAMEDFGIDSDTALGVENLKEAINSKYSQIYPEIDNDHQTDRNGWRRLWLTEHYKLELRKVGQPYE